MQWDTRLDAVDQIFAQCGLRTIDRERPIFRMHDHLRDQRIVMYRHAITVIQGGLDSHAQATGRMMISNYARRRQMRIRIFGIDPAFDRCAIEFDLSLLDPEWLARSDPDAFLDQDRFR